MNEATVTKEARKAANKALAANLRSLVAAGKADQAYALVEGKGEHWKVLVNGACDAVKAKAERAKAKAKETKADKPAKAKGKTSTTPLAVEASPDIAAMIAAAVSAALAGLVPAAAPTAPATPSTVMPVVASWIVRNPESPSKGFAMLVGNRVKAILSKADPDLRNSARMEALDCVKWCDSAAQAETTANAKAELLAKAATYRKAAKDLK